METLLFKTTINSPKEKVWNTMLNDETYRQWTSEFTEGSHYKGSWDEGSKIQFLGPKGTGMAGKIAVNRPHEFISIEITGFISNGKEDTESEEAKAITGVHENYTFNEMEGKTELLVDTGSSEEYKAIFGQEPYRS